MQWGTPQDLEEYKVMVKYFSEVFKKNQNKQYSGTTIIPMAGMEVGFLRHLISYQNLLSQ